MLKKILFLLSLILLNQLVLADESLNDVNTIVFRSGGLNTEGLHPSFITHAPTDEIAQALAQVYGKENSINNRPEKIQVLIPETMNESEAEAYRVAIETEFMDAGFRIPATLIRVPIVSVVADCEQILKQNESMTTDSLQPTLADQQALQQFNLKLKIKLTELKAWSERFSHWREWTQNLKSQWHLKTSQEKTKAVLTIFGAARGIPSIAIYAHDAGLNPINIIRMVYSYGLDIFFTVAPQKVANLPTKIRLPEIKERTQQALSWGLSLGLMSNGMFSNEVSPSAIQFQLANATPFIKEWFDRNVELKAFLMNYSLSLGIPLSFITLGYFAKGGEGSGALNPFDISFLLEFAGLQVVDGIMGMFGGRGARVLGEKAYLSGNQENAFYNLINVLLQIKTISIATGHPDFFKSCLLVKSVLQGLIFFTSRILPPKNPELYVFHAQIGERERGSFLYSEGILAPQQIETVEGMLDQVEKATPGPSAWNRILGSIGFILRNNKTPHCSQLFVALSAN